MKKSKLIKDVMDYIDAYEVDLTSDFEREADSLDGWWEVRRYRGYDYLLLNVKGLGLGDFSKVKGDIDYDTYLNHLEFYNSDVFRMFEREFNETFGVNLECLGRSGGWWGFKIDDLSDFDYVIDLDEDFVSNIYNKLNDDVVFLPDDLLDDDFDNAVKLKPEFRDALNFFYKEIVSESEYMESDEYNDFTEILKEASGLAKRSIGGKKSNGNSAVLVVGGRDTQVLTSCFIENYKDHLCKAIKEEVLNNVLVTKQTFLNEGRSNKSLKKNSLKKIVFDPDSIVQVLSERNINFNNRILRIKLFLSEKETDNQKIIGTKIKINGEDKILSEENFWPLIADKVSELVRRAIIRFNKNWYDTDNCLIRAFMRTNVFLRKKSVEIFYKIQQEKEEYELEDATGLNDLLEYSTKLDNNIYD